MPGNSFGTLFRISTWGESHGGGVGVVIDGCPPGVPLSEADIQPELDRRRPGQSRIVTQRKEGDVCEILSGTFRGVTLGTPISIWVRNTDARPEAYSEMESLYRPSHADFTYDAKYGLRNWQGGGRSSARETIGRVAAAAVAQRALRVSLPGVEVRGWVSQIHEIVMPEPDLSQPVALELVEANAVRCPDVATAERMIRAIEEARRQGDSLGGIVQCGIWGAPAGLGEPVFDRFEADLAKAMLSLPATKGFEVGSGFGAVKLTGRTHNDEFLMKEGRVRTATNRSGGVQGGITNGEPVIFRVAFKPTATIASEQRTVGRDNNEAVLAARGRHDPCVLPRAVPIVEAMAWLVLMDHWMRWLAQCPERAWAVRNAAPAQR